MAFAKLVPTHGTRERVSADTLKEIYLRDSLLRGIVPKKFCTCQPLAPIIYCALSPKCVPPESLPGFACKGSTHTRALSSADLGSLIARFAQDLLWSNCSASSGPSPSCWY